MKVLKIRFNPLDENPGGLKLRQLDAEEDGEVDVVKVNNRGFVLQGLSVKSFFKWKLIGSQEGIIREMISFPKANVIDPPVIAGEGGLELLQGGVGNISPDGTTIKKS